MVGTRLREVGEELFKPFCAIAPVLQEEDVGFDTIATLLRSEGGLLYAEGTFCVQFKARSVTKIEYNEDEYTWFHNLKVPLLIGSVDLDEKHIKLYSTYQLSGWPNARVRSIICIGCDTPSTEERQQDTVYVPLKSPILEWGLQELKEESLRELVYRVLKEWMRFEYLNLQTKQIHFQQALKWKTNNIPRLVSDSTMKFPSELEEDLKLAAPYVFKLCQHRWSHYGVLSDHELGLLMLLRIFVQKGIPEADAHLMSLLARCRKPIKEIYVEYEENEPTSWY